MKPRFPLYVKITAASFFVVLVVLGFVSTVQYREERRALEDKFGLTLQHVAQTTGLFLDGAAHSRVHANSDAAGDDFKKLRDVLERVRRENALKEDAIYTLRPSPSQHGKLEFVVMLQEKTFVGDTFTPAPEAAQVSAWVLADGQARYTPIYTDQYGSFVSAFAPVRDAAQGKVVGLLEVDYGVDRFLAELRAERSKRMWIWPASLLLALALSLGVAFSITGAVKRLVDGTAAVQLGHYDRPVEVTTRDELHTLAESFNAMLGGLRERFAMLKFVPRHTRAVIADSVKGAGTGVVGAVAQVRDVAILFSDIRGFTAISDKLGPARVIEMLNIYLRAEAEIIERHAGSIDKFIGDAVMAVFEGPDRFANAARAAIEIQETMRRLNVSRAFEQPVEVGVGIAGGEVVMGAVGYEDRLEFAVIGRLVNLASRLTAVAGRGEIIVSELAREALGEQYAVEKLDGLKLKGFADAITCYKIRPAAVAVS